MAQLTQRLRFNLANALAGDRERSTDLLKSVLRAILHTKSHTYNLFFSWTEAMQHMSGPLPHAHAHNRFRGRNSRVVFDEIAEVGVSILANGRLQRDRHTHDLSHLAHL